jgi:hypothetical protein
MMLEADIVALSPARLVGWFVLNVICYPLMRAFRSVWAGTSPDISLSSPSLLWYVDVLCTGKESFYIPTL